MWTTNRSSGIAFLDARGSAIGKDLVKFIIEFIIKLAYYVIRPNAYGQIFANLRRTARPENTYMTNSGR